MNAIKGISMKAALLTSGAMLMFAFGPTAHATPVRINFSGLAGGGYVDLTLGSDTDSSAMYQPTYSSSDAASHISPPLSAYDPAGAQHITGASGTFSDAGLGLKNVAIKGLIATSPGMAPPGETLPKSFSWFTAGGSSYSYDNLFYASGSPLACPPDPDEPYVFYGGFLDIFGAMFALDNGDVLALWSDGVTTPGAFGPGWPGGLTYGMNVFQKTAGGYTFDASTQGQFAGVKATVPEPGLLWLFGAGVLGLFARRRSAELRKASNAA
ncbi:MAG: PEP-CTERM sorting domain-containing protein [Rhodanobacter sp.]